MVVESRLARDIAAMAYGKAIHALSPLVAALGPDRRELVFRYLADEYEDFDSSIERLIAPPSNERPVDALR